MLVVGMIIASYEVLTFVTRVQNIFSSQLLVSSALG